MSTELFHDHVVRLVYLIRDDCPTCDPAASVFGRRADAADEQALQALTSNPSFRARSCLKPALPIFSPSVHLLLQTRSYDEQALQALTSNPSFRARSCLKPALPIFSPSVHLLLQTRSYDEPTAKAMWPLVARPAWKRTFDFLAM
jgi:hypothetical protein